MTAKSSITFCSVNQLQRNQKRPYVDFGYDHRFANHIL